MLHRQQQNLLETFFLSAFRWKFLTPRDYHSWCKYALKIRWSFVLNISTYKHPMVNSWGIQQKGQQIFQNWICKIFYLLHESTEIKLHPSMQQKNMNQQNPPTSRPSILPDSSGNASKSSRIFRISWRITLETNRTVREPSNHPPPLWNLARFREGKASPFSLGQFIMGLLGFKYIYIYIVYIYIIHI